MEIGEKVFDDGDEEALMPPRWLCWLIVLFWLTTTAWLFWRDLWPSWRPGEPPPFHIDDVAEVLQRRAPRINWTVERGKVGEDHLAYVFHAETWMEYQEEGDTFSLHAKLEVRKAPPGNPRSADPKAAPQEVRVANLFKIDGMTSAYRVTRAGQLRSLQADVAATPHFEDRPGEGFSLVRTLLRTLHRKGPEKSSVSQPISLRLWGEVRGDQFFGHCRVEAKSLSKPMTFDLPATAVSYTGSVLMPLHPVNQMSGLRPGQSWRQPLVDPLRDAFASLPGFSGGVRFLDARVLPQPEMLQWGSRETSCLVIEYTDDEKEIRGHTWVEQSSNRVLRQEANLDDNRWRMTREPPRRLSKNQRDE